jgi:PAS domain S-box-containing protein
VRASESNFDGRGERAAPGVRSAFRRYAAGVLLAAAGLAARFGLALLTGDETPFLAFVAAVVVSAWYGGLGPGVVTTALLALAGSFLPVSHAYPAVRLGIFVAEGILISSLSGALHVFRGRAEDRRARAEAAEARLGKLVESAPDAIVVADAAGRITLVNAQAERMFGYSRDELLTGPVEVLLPERHREGHVDHRARYQADPHTRPMGAGLDLLARRKDGSEFPVEISLSPLDTRDGPLVMSVVRDITERKQIEEQIRGLNRDLERRVAELHALNRELETFSYSVSHDLRAPLRAIDGFGQALLEEYHTQLDPQGKDYLRRVRAASQRMGQLIDDLLDLSRVTRREMRHEPVDLSTLARLVGAQLRRANPEHRVEFAVAPGLAAEADPHLLRIVLENLLGNAWKFTGGRPDARIEFGAGTEEGRPVYYVRDNGVGFDMAYAAKLFGAFQRLHAMTEFPGTGIGLATVQRIIHRHGGRVWADGAVGEGATFYFTL